MTMHWQHIGNYFYDNRVAIISGVTLLVSSAVKTLPQPGITFDRYTFLYDWSHQFLNITNTRPVATPVTPPVLAAESVAITK
jgi:hypothetical protein